MGESNAVTNTDEKKKLTSEVTELMELIRVHESNVKEAHRDLEEEKAEKLSKFALIVSGSLIGIIFLIAKYTPHKFWLKFQNPIVILQLLTLFLYLVAFIYILIELRNSKVLFRPFWNPTSSSIKSLSKTMQLETTLFRKLDSFSIASIQYTSKRLKLHYERVSQLKLYCIGAIEKVGLLPGFIAAIAALVAALNGQNWVFLYMLSLSIGILVGFYLALIPMLFASLNMKQYGAMLEQYLFLQRDIG